MRQHKTVHLTGHAGTLRRILLLLLLCMAAGSGSLVFGASDSGASETSSALEGDAFLCENPGWFPEEFALKDHTVFTYDGLYYLASTYLASDDYEEQFAYASSPDLCHWTDLGGILSERTPGTWDEFRIWAPYVYEEDGVYYLYYTGVTRGFAQSIMLATSTDPSESHSWQPQGVVFQPSHPEAVWAGSDAWSDCRDATVLKKGLVYRMYYTGLDESGGIVGVAKATSPLGPWYDWGAIADTTPGSVPESPTLASHDGLYWLFYSDAGPAGWGQVYRHGETPFGPWSKQYVWRPGWAHEIWTGLDGKSYTSFVSDGGVGIRRYIGPEYYDPAHPFVGAAAYHAFLPVVLH